MITSGVPGLLGSIISGTSGVINCGGTAGLNSTTSVTFSSPIAIGDEKVTEVVELSPAVPPQLITPEVPEIIDPNNPGTPDVITSPTIFSAEVPYAVLDKGKPGAPGLPLSRTA